MDADEKFFFIQIQCILRINAECAQGVNYHET